MKAHEGYGRLLVRLFGLVLLTIIGLSWKGFAPAAAGNQADVSDKVSVTRSGIVFNRQTNTYDSTVTLKNTSQDPIAAPLSLVISTITPNTVTLANKSGNTADGKPFIDVALVGGSLAPGQSISGLVLKFNNPQRVSFSITTQVWATVETANALPVAQAGPDQTVAVGDTVTLDGSASSDADGDALSFRWSLVSMPATSLASLSDSTAVRPTFNIDRPGDYQLQLIVNDAKGDSALDTLTVSTRNSPPVADAGVDQTAFMGDTVALDGSRSSDADGDTLSFRWSLKQSPQGSGATLSNPSAINPSFKIDRAGSYLAELIVNDGTVDSVADAVTISTKNSAPVANAGVDKTALVGDTVRLDASASTDVDGDALRFDWSLISVPQGSSAALSDPNALDPGIPIDVFGDYVAQLIVSDGQVNSTPDTVTITTANSAPTANAGADQTVFVGTKVFLDGSASLDVDRQPLTYRWSLITRPTGSSAALNDLVAASPSFTADRAGNYTAQLLVNDGTVDSAPDQVVISTQNSRPVANAGPDLAAKAGEILTLDGHGSSDADGDPLSFKWSLLSKPADSQASLTGADTQSASFAADKAGDYIAQLIVNDGQLASDPDTAKITITVPAPPPTANRDPRITSTPVTAGTVGTSYSYDLEASDPDGDSLIYSLAVAPAGMSIDSSTGLINWTPSATGDFPVTVKVEDGGGTATQIFTVAVAQAQINVPNVVGQTETQATNTIRDAGLLVGTIARASSDTVPQGNVVSQVPLADALAAPGSVVDLVISSGSAGGGGGLPPDPGLPGEETIDGIDSDADGVRDDLQRYIALNPALNESSRRTLSKYVIAIQDAMDTGLSDTEAESIGQHIWLQLDCAWSSGGDAAITAAKELEALAVNTEERFNAYISFMVRLSGAVYTLQNSPVCN